MDTGLCLLATHTSGNHITRARAVRGARFDRVAEGVGTTCDFADRVSSRGLRLARVGFRILPVVWRLDPSVDARMGLEERQEVSAVEQLDRFALGEVVGRFAVLACRDEYALGCALVLECAEQVADCRDTDSVFVAFGLDDDFAAQDGIGVVGDAVDAAVPRSSGLPGI